MNVSIYIGLDPARMTFFLNWENQFKSKLAHYAQIIHTSNTFGNNMQTGDVDIFVDYSFETMKKNFLKRHGISVFLHIATATKRLFLLAEENGKGKIIANTCGNQSQPIHPPNECLIGIYGTLNECKHGKSFKMSLIQHSTEFWNHLNGLVNEKFFL